MAISIFRPYFRGFDQVDKTAHCSLGLRNKNSFSFDPIWPWPKVFHTNKNFLNRKFFHVKIGQNLNFTLRAKSVSAPYFFLDFSIPLKNYGRCRAKSKFLSVGFALNRRNRILKWTGPWKTNNRWMLLNRPIFLLLLAYFTFVSIKKGSILLIWVSKWPKTAQLWAEMAISDNQKSWFSVSELKNFNSHLTCMHFLFPLSRFRFDIIKRLK